MLDKKKFIWEEKIPPFLIDKMELLKQKYGNNSREDLAIARQYRVDNREKQIDYKAERNRHYEADLIIHEDNMPLKHLERLYRRVALIELTTICIAHCRWCLRANYPKFTQKKEDIIRAAKYFGSSQNKDDLREVLITGGDPFLLPELLDFTIDSIIEFAPNIEIIRIGSRLPTQDPERINKKLLHALRKRNNLRIEVATQINHPLELWKETKKAYKILKKMGITIYNQQVLIRGVNDDLDTLVQLYNGLRDMGIEAHYMFHCCPIKGMSHHRTSVEEGLELIKGLTSSGHISGRSKPMYTAMTDIGKVTLYEGVILDKRGDMILLQTKYSLEERIKWNPSWRIPDSAHVDENGYLRVWYKDGKVHDRAWPTTYFFNE